jgi:hypothetical protein
MEKTTKEDVFVFPCGKDTGRFRVKVNRIIGRKFIQLFEEGSIINRITTGGWIISGFTGTCITHSCVILMLIPPEENKGEIGSFLAEYEGLSGSKIEHAHRA